MTTYIPYSLLYMLKPLYSRLVSYDHLLYIPYLQLYMLKPLYSRLVSYDHLYTVFATVHVETAVQ